MKNLHVLKERLPLLLLRSQVSDAEYEHLKNCPTCMEAMANSAKKVTWRDIVGRTSRKPEVRERSRT
jgi:hypothetical protein